jgi:hypothetical protein
LNTISKICGDLPEPVTNTLCRNVRSAARKTTGNDQRSFHEHKAEATIDRQH